MPSKKKRHGPHSLKSEKQKNPGDDQVENRRQLVKPTSPSNRTPSAASVSMAVLGDHRCGSRETQPFRMLNRRPVLESQWFRHAPVDP